MLTGQAKLCAENYLALAISGIPRDYCYCLTKSCSMDECVSAPTFASLSLIGRCNSRCLHCGSWESPLQGPSTDCWIEVVDQVAALGIQHLNLSGGEPLLRADLPALVAQAKKRRLIVQLSTNGLLLGKEVFHQCVAAGLDYVTVSLDTLDPQTFFQIRGGHLYRVLDGIDTALQLCKMCPGLRVGLKCVVSRLNLQDVFDLIDMAVARKLYLGLQPFHAQFTDNPSAVSRLAFSESDILELEETFDRIVKKKESGIIINHVSYLAHFPQFLVYGILPASFSCCAGEETVNIDVHLNLKPCWMFPPIGNLANQPLVTLWKSPKFDAVRSKMKSRQCTGCWLTCHTDLSPKERKW